MSYIKSIQGGTFNLRAGAELRVYDSDDSNYIGHKAPDLSANKSWYMRNTIVNKTADYTITDTDGYSDITVSHSAGTYMVTITLPTLADNQGRVISVYNVGTGICKIDGEGAETINGLAQYYLFWDGDNITVIAHSNGWRILKYKGEIRSGYINRNDWTAVHIGTMNCPTDGNSGAALLMGEQITEETSGNTARILNVGASNLILYNCTGTGFFTNNKRVTGGVAGGYRLVNTGTTTKNIDYDFAHYFGVGMLNLDIKLMIASTGADSTSFLVEYVNDNAASNKGITHYQVDTNSFRIQTNAEGVNSVTDAGATLIIDSEDWYYNAIARYII